MARATLSKGLGLGTLTFGITGVFGVASSILTARLFGIEVVGQFALVMAPAYAVAVFSTVREQPALVRKLAGTTPGDPLVTGLFGAVFAFSLALTVVTAVATGLITWAAFRGPIDQPDLIAPAAVALAGYVLIVNTSWNLDSIFTAFMASGPLFRARLTQALLFPVFAVGLYLVRDDVWALVAAHYGSWAIATGCRLWEVRILMPYRLPTEARRQGLRELPGILRFGFRIMPGFLAIGISNSAGIWILGASSSVTAVGAYSRAGSVAGRLGELNFRITEMLFPTLVSRRLESDSPAFDRAAVDSLRYTLAGLLAPAAAFGGAAHGILALFGPSFEVAATALTMLMVAPAVMSGTAILAHTMFALNRTNATTVIACVRLLVTVGGGFVLTAAYGIDGMAAAFLLGAATQFVAQAVVTLPQLTTPVRQLWPGRQVIGVAAAFAGGFGMARMLDDAVPGLAGLVLALVFGLVAYGALLIAVGGLLPRDRRRVMLAREFTAGWTKGAPWRGAGSR